MHVATGALDTDGDARDCRELAGQLLDEAGEALLAGERRLEVDEQAARLQQRLLGQPHQRAHALAQRLVVGLLAEHLGVGLEVEREHVDALRDAIVDLT